MKELKEYTCLKDLVNDCGGIENFRFFGHLNKYDFITPFGVALTSYSDDWVECKIEEDTSADSIYALEGGYQVWVVPVYDDRYAGYGFYQSDFLSMIEKGNFILKTDENQHIVEKEGYEHLCGNAYLHHYWSEIVEE